jgi:hypothetical protein
MTTPDEAREALLDDLLTVIAGVPDYLSGKDKLRSLLVGWTPPTSNPVDVPTQQETTDE